MKRIFRIHATDIEVERLLDSVEERLEGRAWSFEELERLKNLSFTPAPPQKMESFNASALSQLFEEPVALPLFSSIRSSMMRELLRATTSWFFRLSQRLYEKLSQNKIEAFYRLAYEMMATRQRLDRLERLIAESGRLTSQPFDTTISSTASVSVVAAEAQLLSPLRERLDRQLVARLEPYLVESPKRTLELNGVALELGGERVGQYLRPLGWSRVDHTPPTLGRAPQATYGLIAWLTLEQPLYFSDSATGASAAALPPLALLLQLAGSIEEGGWLLLRYCSGESGTIFQLTPRISVDCDRLTEELELLGLEVVERHIPEGLLTGSMEWICRKPLSVA